MDVSEQYVTVNFADTDPAAE